MNIVDVSLINDYFDDGSTTSKLPTMVAPTPEYEIFIESDTVWDLHIIEKESFWKHMDNEILGKVCFHTVLNCNSKNRLVGQSKRRYRKSETAGFIFILLLFSHVFSLLNVVWLSRREFKI